jgi:hypothetical protein
MLKQSLMTLRLAFVEAADAPTAAPAAKTETPAAQGRPDAPPSAGSTPHREDEEHRKKFSKKY